MGRVNDTISNVNSALRNLILAVLVGGAGFFGYKGYEVYNEPKQKLADKEAELQKTADSLKKANEDLAARQKEIGDLNKLVADKTAQIDRMEVSMQLLKVRHRLARLRVLEQQNVPSLNPPTPVEGTENPASRPNFVTKVEFVEVNDQGQPIGEAKQFEIVGDMVYVDYLRVTFDDTYIEQADLDRSTAIAVFQRIFGEHQEPAQGFQLDTVGSRPTVYARGAAMSEFEKKIWTDFWLIANDPARAKELGIHAAHGAAVAMRVQPGKTYEIELRSTGDITFKPVDGAAPIAPPAPGGEAPSRPLT
ncbi:MAG: hypothetical protein U0805_19385 [Pirellulales bacterium]